MVGRTRVAGLVIVIGRVEVGTGTCPARVCSCNMGSRPMGHGAQPPSFEVGVDRRKNCWKLVNRIMLVEWVTLSACGKVMVKKRV